MEKKRVTFSKDTVNTLSPKQAYLLVDFGDRNTDVSIHTAFTGNKYIPDGKIELAAVFVTYENAIRKFGKYVIPTIIYNGTICTFINFQDFKEYVNHYDKYIIPIVRLD
jgi:hypothetical protein